MGASRLVHQCIADWADLLEMDGVATSNGSPVPSAAVGVATFDGAGNIARTDGLSGYYTDESDGGTLNTVQYPSGTYNVDANLRTDSPAVRTRHREPDRSASQPVWYLVSTNQAFALDTNAAVMARNTSAATVPTPNGFTFATLLGTYLAGTITPVLPSVTNELDVAEHALPRRNLGLRTTIQWTNRQVPGSFLGAYDCGGTPPHAPPRRRRSGRYEITGPADRHDANLDSLRARFRVAGNHGL